MTAPTTRRHAPDDGASHFKGENAMEERMEERNELADILEMMDGADFMDIAEAIQKAGFFKGETE